MSKKTGSRFCRDDAFVGIVLWVVAIALASVIGALIASASGQTMVMAVGDGRTDKPLDYYVAADGQVSAQGTITDPLELWCALRGACGAVVIAEGSRVWLEPGVYPVPEGHQPRLSVSGARFACLDYPACFVDYHGLDRTHTFTVLESAVGATLENVVVIDSSTNRQVLSEPGSNPASGGSGCINVYGPDTQLVNFACIGAQGSGIGLWRQAVGMTARGIVAANVGWLGPDRGHGPGIYTQNEAGIVKTIDAAIVHTTGYIGFEANTSAADVSSYRISRLAIVNPGAKAAYLAGNEASVPFAMLFIRNNDGGPIQDVRITELVRRTPTWAFGGGVAFRGTPSQGVRDVQLDDLSLTGVDGLSIDNISGPVVVTRVVSQEGPLPPGVPVEGRGPMTLTMAEPSVSLPLTVDNNAYYKATQPSGGCMPTALRGWCTWRLARPGMPTTSTWEQWRDAGLDANSTAQFGERTGQRLHLWEVGRVVYIAAESYSGADMELDLASVMHIGQAYRVYDVRNLALEPRESGRYWPGGQLTIPGAERVAAWVLVRD